MAIPTSRTEYKQYCLRQLGAGINDINVTDEQVEDCIDDALNYYRDWHYDGTERYLYKHQVTTDDKTNRYITMPSNVHGVIGALDIGTSGSSSSLFNIEYQIRLYDLFDFSSTSFMPYVNTKRHIETIQEIFNGSPIVRYNRNTGVLHIDFDWDVIDAGNYIIVDCYAYPDPNVYTAIWNDPWLKKYGTALIGRQWGRNLSKFAGMQLPGGLTLDGDKILREYSDMIEKMEEEMISKYSHPPEDQTG